MTNAFTWKGQPPTLNWRKVSHAAANARTATATVERTRAILAQQQQTAYSHAKPKGKVMTEEAFQSAMQALMAKEGEIIELREALLYFMGCVEGSAHLDNARLGAMGGAFDMARKALRLPV